MKTYSSLVLFGLLLLGVACGVSSSPTESTESATALAEKAVAMPDFDADSAYLFVSEQMDFGPRVPQTSAHALCARYLEKKMLGYADEVTVQDFSMKIWNGERRAGKNIIASFAPEHPQRLLLAAHWDSRPMADHDPLPENWAQAVPGANDGASGVGVLLEIARQLSIKAPSVGVDIIFFDLEDWGTPQNEEEVDPDTWCLGSQYWAENPHKIGYSAYYGILLDMVGCAQPCFTREGISMYYASDIVDKVWKTAHQLGFSSVFRNEKTGMIVDDHLYVNKIAKIPMINIIHYDSQTATHFYPYWHTVHDDLSKIDKNTLRIVGQVVLAQIYRE